MSVTYVGYDRVTSGTDDVILTPRTPISRAPFVYCHSATSTPTEAVGSVDSVYTLRKFNTRATDMGFSVIAADHDYSFGTSGLSAGYSFAGRVQDSIDYHRSSLLGTADPVVLMAASMGCANAVMYAMENPGNVACILGMIPALDIVDMYQNDVDGLRVYIEVGWEITYPTALPSTADLVTRASELNIPARFYYSNNDAITSSAAVTAFGNAGAEMVDLGALGHTDAALQAVPLDDAMDFIQTHAPA